MRNALVAVGSNQPNGKDCPSATVRKARRVIESESVRVLHESALYSTPAFPKGAGPDYVNACWVLETGLCADGLLAHLHAVEAQFSRRRQGRWGARTLDLDLLSLGAQVLPDAATQGRWREMPLEKQPFSTPTSLILPHPRIQDRPFVLVPLADVAPHWRHPITEQTAAEMLERFPQSEIEAIKPID